MFVLLTGYVPFYGNTDKEILSAIEEKEPDFKEEEWEDKSSEAKDLVLKMLNKDQYSRISCNDAINHPWFKKFNLTSEVPEIELQNIYNSLITFKVSSEYLFQQATISYMLHNIVKQDDIKYVRQLFINLDKRGFGKLSYKEIVTGFESKLSGVSESKINKVFKSIDINSTGYIEYSEFLRACINKVNLLSETNLKNTFTVLSKSENVQFISPSEFKSVLGLQSKFSDSVWEEIIRKIDINGDNQIEYDEFKEVMLKFIEN